jgi:hypothetical protein
LIALLLVSFGGTAIAAAPGEDAALFRLVATLAGSPMSSPIPVVEESPARFQSRRATLAVRGYGPLAQTHDAAVLDALGIAATRKTLETAVVRSHRQVALYDTRTRRVHVQKGAPNRRAAVARAFVSGLQYRQYGLGRIVPLERDARLAALAAGQGQATLVGARLARVAAVPARGSRVDRFVALETGFTSSVGLRFAATLQNLGGRRAVATSLSRPPQSTEQIFHIDKFLERERPAKIVFPVAAAGLRRVSVGTFGELDVRTLLAVVGAPRVDATGSGWAGGRTAIYEGAGAEAALVVLAWDTLADVDEWARAVPTYFGLALDLPDATPSPCEATTCWQIGGRGIAFLRSGKLTALAISGDTDGAAAVARAALEIS